MKISIITPTCDRPVAFALAEKFIARQTLKPDEWIVADGGQTKAQCTMGQIHLHESSAPGARNFASNLLRGIAQANGDVIIFVEDDDWLRSDHIECMATVAKDFPLIGSEEKQHYYNVAHRCWRTFKNVGASMCQTGIRRELWPVFQAMVRSCMSRNTYGIDTYFWQSIPRDKWGMVGQMTVLGIKGLPGSAGLGVGHRPVGPLWNSDPMHVKLKSWIGMDSVLYESF